MSIPGVQKPHCSPWHSMKPFWIGSSLPSFSRPSTVVMSWPAADAASIVQLYRVLGGGWEDLVPAGTNDENSTAKAAIQEADSAVEKSPARLAAESPLVKTAAKSTESGSNK